MPWARANTARWRRSQALARFVVVRVGQVGAVVDQQPRDVAAGLVGGVTGRVGQRFGLQQAPVGVIELDQPVDDHLRAGVVDGAVGQRGPHRGPVHDPQGCVHQIPAERAEVTVIAATVATAPDTRWPISWIRSWTTAITAARRAYTARRSASTSPSAAPGPHRRGVPTVGVGPPGCRAVRPHELSYPIIEQGYDKFSDVNHRPGPQAR